MANSAKAMKKSAEKKENYPFPSRYGSHKSMIVKEYDNSVVCKDEYGEYLTEKKQLDSGLADPNRHATVEYREKILDAFYYKMKQGTDTLSIALGRKKKK